MDARPQPQRAGDEVPDPGRDLTPSASRTPRRPADRGSRGALA